MAQVLLCLFVLIPAHFSNAEEVDTVIATTVDKDGNTIVFAPTSYAVRQMPSYPQWKEWVKERPYTFQSFDGKTIAVCVMCAIKMDVTNDLHHRIVSQRKIKVGAKVKMPERERTGDEEITVYMVPKLVMRVGFACESCWKEYIRVEDSINTQNKQRQELNAGRRRLQQLLDQMSGDDKRLEAPILVQCDKHPSMKGYCACLSVKREKRKAMPVRERQVIPTEETEQLPMLSAYIDVAKEVKAMEVRRRDDTTWEALAEQRAEALPVPHQG